MKLSERIARRILEMDGFSLVVEQLRDVPRGGYDLEAFTADVARSIDNEVATATAEHLTEQDRYGWW